MVKQDMTAPKMTRVTVRVPKTTLEQINDWVDTLGVRRSHFLGIALVAGVRSLIQASALELSLDQNGGTPHEDKKHPARPEHLEDQIPDVESMDRESLIGTVQALQIKIARLQSEGGDHQDHSERSGTTRPTDVSTTPQRVPGHKRSAERAAV